MVEPWLRGTHTEIDAVRRQVLHALELATEDVARWCSGLSDAAIHERPSGVASVAFHLRHMTRSLDRLLTYAEGGQLSPVQLAQLGTEMEPLGTTAATLEEFRASLEAAVVRIGKISPDSYEEARSVGRAKLPSTVGGLLVHCAEHTQRHLGQAITTAKVVSRILPD
jgi:uncharacterized damage-inducible protein DinB